MLHLPGWPSPFASYDICTAAGPWLVTGAAVAITAAVAVVIAVRRQRRRDREAAASLAEANEALRRTAADLREREEKYRHAFKNSPAALHTLDANLRILAVSYRWCEMLQYRRDDVVGRDVRDFICADDGSRGKIGEHLPELLRTGTLREFERVFIRADGSRVSCLVTAKVEWQDSGDPIIHATVQDVTLRKTAEAKLRETEQHLAQARKMEAIGQLVGGVAHDFNNALQAISGNLSLISAAVGRLADGAMLDAAQQTRLLRQVDNARGACTQAAQTAKQLLTVARRQQLQPVPFDPCKVLRELEGLFNGAAKSAGNIALRWRLAPDAGHCLADPHQLKAALLNLVNNACDALSLLPNGGSIIFGVDAVRLEASNDPDRPKAGNYIRISVCDDGPGMAPEVQARAFEPFFTTKAFGTGTGGTGGTGLGLAQTYGFARQSGGTVEIQTAPDRGCCVAILLPRCAAAGEDDRGCEDKMEIGGGETILVVDDEVAVREALAGLLTELLGYQVIQAEDGEKALAALRTPGVRIDALLTDNAMPNLRGLPLIRIARKEFPNMPMMLLTGRMDGPVEEVTALGARYVAKPYEPAAIAKALREMLARSVSA